MRHFSKFLVKVYIEKIADNRKNQTNRRLNRDLKAGKA